jgi:hypothetical protein
VRILLADSGRDMRGGQWQTLYLARGLRESGESVRLLAEGGLLATARAEGFDAAPFGAAALWRWSRWADIAHAQDARSHTAAALLRTGPLVVSRRVGFPIGPGAASRWKYRRAARYIAISRYVARMLAAGGVEPERIVVVPDGVPEPEERLLAWNERPVQFLAIRTNDPMKGDDLLRNAAALSGIDVTWSTRIARDLPKARVFVYISRSEGLGSAALLGMANGTAVLASRVGGLEEAVEHEKTGLLVENRPDAIAAAMSRLVNDPVLACSLAASGRERAQREFSVTKMVRGTAEVYRSVPR